MSEGTITMAYTHKSKSASPQTQSKDAGPLAIVAAVVFCVLLLGFLWYHFLGPGSSGINYVKSEHEVPLDKLDPRIRTMFAPSGAGGTTAGRPGGAKTTPNKRMPDPTFGP